MPLTQIYEDIEPWACEAGCGIICEARRVEVSPRFLRITYRCSTCRALAIRYYDLEKRGYRALNGRPDQGRNSARNIDSYHFRKQQCRYASACPRAKVSRLLKTEDLEQQHMDIAARIVQTHCRDLSEHELKCCFNRLFDMSAPSLFYDRFRSAYLNER